MVRVSIHVGVSIIIKVMESSSKTIDGCRKSMLAKTYFIDDYCHGLCGKPIEKYNKIKHPLKLLKIMIK